MLTDEIVTKIEETKGAARSKINIAGILIILCSAVSDPMFKTLFGDLIPEQWVTRITFVIGWLVIYFRSNSESNVILDWKNLFKPKTLALVERKTETNVVITPKEIV